MEILNPLSSLSNAQTAFTIYPGKQITLHAKGLAGDDKVFVEILELSKAPDFTGNPCCTFYRTDIQVVARTPLLCPDGRPTELTAEYPVGVMNAPQSVTLGVRVEADDAAVVSVELYETDSDGCVACICDRPPTPCEDATWTPTGEERCVGANVEKQELSNCGNSRWSVDRPQTWTPTGETRCVNNLVEAQEENDCGKTRWVATTTVCGFCPSYPVPRDLCDGQSAYAFRECDTKDPLATVEIVDCDGANKVYVYPSCGDGHSVPVTDCDGVLLGYAANTSDCVQNETLYIEVNALPTIDVNPIEVKSLPTVEVAPIEIESLPTIDVNPIDVKSLPTVEVAPIEIESLPTIDVKKHVVSSETYQGKLYYIWSDGTKTEDDLPAEPTVYCPSLRLSCDGSQPGFGFHLLDPKDPAATVEMAPCADDISVDSVWIYPSAAPGHTVKVTDCDGNIIGYAANRSACAPECPCN